MTRGNTVSGVTYLCAQEANDKHDSIPKRHSFMQDKNSKATAAQQDSSSVSTGGSYEAFNIHMSLIRDLIHRQAGTVERAGAELVMNGLDAQARRIDIDLSDTRLLVTDDGVGLPDDETEMRRVFMTLGAPHERDAQGRSTDARFGSFRIGRLQALAWGECRWLSGLWDLRANIKDESTELGMTITPLKSRRIGTSVEIKFFKPLENWQKLQFLQHMRTMCQYVDYCDVRLNGKSLALPVSPEWTIDNEDYKAIINDTPSLKVFMMGVPVMERSKWQMGVGGIVVTKKQMVVNFARNDVHSSCELWQRITKDLGRLATKKVKSSRAKLDDDEILATWRRLVEIYMRQSEQSWGFTGKVREAFPDLKFKTAKIFVDASGKRFSVADLRKDLAQNKFTADAAGLLRITIAPMDPATTGDLIQAAKAGQGLVLHTLFSSADPSEGHVWLVAILAALFELPVRTWEEIPGELPYLLRRSRGSCNSVARLVSNEEFLADATEPVFRLLKHDQLTSAEFKFATAVSEAIATVFSEESGLQRHLRVSASSSNTDVWTDGSTYIAIDQEYLGRLMRLQESPYGLNGMAHKLAMDILEMLAYDTDTRQVVAVGASFDATLMGLVQENLTQLHCAILGSLRNACRYLREQAAKAMGVKVEDAAKLRVAGMPVSESKLLHYYEELSKSTFDMAAMNKFLTMPPRQNHGFWHAGTPRTTIEEWDALVDEFMQTEQKKAWAKGDETRTGEGSSK